MTSVFMHSNGVGGQKRNAILRSGIKMPLSCNRMKTLRTLLLLLANSNRVLE